MKISSAEPPANSSEVHILISRGMTRHRKALIAILFAAALVLWGTGHASAQADGQIFFANFGGGVDAPVFKAGGGPITAPSPYVADLFWSINTNAAMDGLTPVGRLTPFNGPTPPYGSGYFSGGLLTLPFAYLLAQVRVWDTNYGSTYYEARDHGGEFGISKLIIVQPLPPPGSPSSLTGLQSFRLQRLPRLTINLTKTNTVLLSWSVEVTSYALQQNRGLDAVDWITLTNIPVVVGLQNQVVIPKPQENLFYRLISR